MINESEFKTKKEKIMRNGICVSAIHGLTLKMNNKTKCGLRRAHFVNLGKNVFERKVREKRKKS